MNEDLTIYSGRKKLDTLDTYYVLEPLLGQDLSEDRLRDIVRMLKQEDAEAWAIGEVLERLLNIEEKEDKSYGNIVDVLSEAISRLDWETSTWKELAAMEKVVIEECEMLGLPYKIYRGTETIYKNIEE